MHALGIGFGPLEAAGVDHRGEKAINLEMAQQPLGRVGAVEWVYPETAFYADGL